MILPTDHQTRTGSFVIIYILKSHDLHADVYCHLFFRIEVDDDKSSSSDGDRTLPVVKDLAMALLQIVQGVEPKYLNPPLGKHLILRLGLPLKKI